MNGEYCFHLDLVDLKYLTIIICLPLWTEQQAAFPSSTHLQPFARHLKNLECMDVLDIHTPTGRD
jgi:hypothetical protein